MCPPRVWAVRQLPLGAIFLHAPAHHFTQCSPISIPGPCGGQDEVFAIEQAIDALVATAQALVVQADIFKYPARSFFTYRALLI